MCDNNSFNVVFGGGGSGGGGGTINSGSNVGTGTIEVFKQVVGSDLEFRTLADTDSIGLSYVENDIDPLLNSTIEANVILGKIGIRQLGGWYTFYGSLADAFSDAVLGDVIEFFADIEDKKTKTLYLVDGVDVNLNGYTYTYAPQPADNTSMFYNDGNGTTNNFRNGTLVRKNALAQTTLGEGEVFTLTGNLGEFIQIDLHDCVLINASRNVISMQGDTTAMSISGGTIYGGGTIDDGVNPPNFFSSYLGGNILNMNFRVNEFVVLQTGCNATNLTIYNEDLSSSTGGISVDNSVLSNCFVKSLKTNLIAGSTINNCTFISNESGTLDCTQSKLQNCTIEYFVNGGGGAGSEALNIDGCIISNCYVICNNNFSLSAVASFVLNSIIISSGITYVINDDGGNTIANSTIYNTNDAVDGNLGGIFCAVATGDSNISNNTIIISDSTSYGVAGIVTSSGFFVSNIFQGTSNLISGSVTNSQVLITDTFGNIQVG